MKERIIMNNSRNIRLLISSSSRITVAGFACLVLLMTHLAISRAANIRKTDDVQRPVPEADVNSVYGKLPLSFEANRGQTDDRVKFLARAGGYTLFLTSTEAVLQLRSAVSGVRNKEPVPAKRRSANRGAAIRNAQSTVLRTKLVGANRNAHASGLDELPGKSNYFIGNDPKRWRTNIPTYAKVKFAAVYPGIDVVYYGTQGRQMEYDFVVAAGADPKTIKLSFAGTEKLKVDGQGDLALRLNGKELRLRKPVVYQEKDGVRQEIAGGYKLASGHEVGFEIGAYDATRSLVIDPILAYSTYLGGSGQDIGLGIAVNAHGDAFVTGLTTSLDFPPAPAAPKLGPGGNVDAFVSKLSADGTQLVYSTYLGGSNDENLYSTFDIYSGIAVNSAGNAFVTGLTTSPDFPHTSGVKQENYGGGAADAYVAKLSPAGNALEYSTFLGGDGWEGAHSIALDTAENAYVAGAVLPGNMPIPPTTPNDAQKGAYDGFVTILNSSGSNLNFFSYLGGSGWDGAHGVAVDAQNNFYVVGSGGSSDLKVTSDAFQISLKGGTDIFIWKFRAGGTLEYLTYLGGAAKSCPTNPDDLERTVNHGIAVEPKGNIIYVTGTTDSTDFPTNNPMPLNGCFTGFAAKLDIKQPNNQLVYSRFLGGSSGGAGRAIAADINGDAYVTGVTSGAFPATPAMPTCSDTGAYVIKLAADGAVKYAACLSGAGEDVGHDLAIDPAGCAYVTGYTQSPNFPVVNPFQSSFGGGTGPQPQDAFVTKICSGLDHFKCYDVNSDAKFVPFDVVLRDQFETQVVTIIKPVMLCNPAVKCLDRDCTQLFNPDDHLVCYATKDSQGTPNFERREVIVSNQFGQQQRLTVLKRSNMLCVPSLKMQ
jgi:hypothetical protein